MSSQVNVSTFQQQLLSAGIMCGLEVESLMQVAAK